MARLAPSAIFFDFDGVLVESTAIKAEAFASIYAPFGSEVLAAAIEHHEANEGISRLIKFRHCHKTLLGIELDDNALADLARHYTAEVEDRVIACDSVRGATEFLTQHHEEIPFFVISGTPDDELKRIVEQRHMAKYFREVRGSPETKDSILNELLKTYHLNPDHTLFVGDAMADYQAASRCSVPFLGRVAKKRPTPFPEGTNLIEDLFGLETLF